MGDVKVLEKVEGPRSVLSSLTAGSEGWCVLLCQAQRPLRQPCVELRRQGPMGTAALSQS